MPLQELNWCMKELAQLQKEKNDWRCNSWLESATGRSTVLAAPPGKILKCACMPACLPVFSLDWHLAWSGALPCHSHSSHVLDAHARIMQAYVQAQTVMPCPYKLPAKRSISFHDSSSQCSVGLATRGFCC